MIDAAPRIVTGVGQALPCTMPGCIPAEAGIQEVPDGNSMSLLWEKWERQEDNHADTQDADRRDEGEFTQPFFACVWGEPQMGLVTWMA